MRERTLTRVVLAGALALPPAALTGCSALFSAPPPKTPLVTADQCSTNGALPRVDVAGAAASGIVAATLLGVAAIEHENNMDTIVPSWDSKPMSVDPFLYVGGAVLTAAMVGLGISAHHGYKNVEGCEAAQLDLARRSPQLWYPNAPYPYAYPPAPPPPQPAPPPRSPPPVPTRPASVVSPSAEVRSAPFNVAPVIVTLDQGQRLLVAETPNDGWRVVFLDGRVGYVQDAQIKVDSR